MSHVTHTNESCHTHEWVMSHTRMSHVTHTNESCHTHEWVMSHIWASHVIRIHVSCHTPDCVMSHARMIFVTHLSDSCHTQEYMCMSHTWLYGVVLVGRIDKIIGLFCKRALLKRLYSAKETYNFIDPTDRSHPICVCHTHDYMYIRVCLSQI